MCTFLGIAGKINENDVDPSIVKNSEITFLEGYLWDEGDPKKAFEKAILNSNKVVMSLSDLFCVERHKKNFLELAKNKIDLIFSNEQEILSLTNSKSFDDAISFSKEVSDCSIIRIRSKSRSIPRKHCGYSLAAPTLKVDMSGFLPNVLREKSMT